MLNLLGLSKNNEPSTSDCDPMNLKVFPDEIRQELLSYLPVSDLLSASLVSKLWLESIGSSIVFKKNIVIKLHSWNNQDPPDVARSQRDYEILTISDSELSSKALNGLRDKTWKQVTMSIGRIKSQKSFIKLMQAFEDVKNLKVLSTHISKLNSDIQPLILPQLESLVLSDVTLDLFDALIVAQPSLKSLSLRFISCDIASPRRVGEALVEFFQLNHRLKDLEMNHLVTNDLFLVDITKNVNLKLRSLALGLDSTSPAARDHIEKFMRSQGDSLEYLKLVLHQKFIKRGQNEWGYWNYPNENEEDRRTDDIFILFNVWNSMTSLKSIAIRFLQSSAEIEANRELMKTLKRNTNVISLYVQFMNVSAPASIVLEIMKLSPNLQTLYVTKLTPAVVRFAAINLIALRNLLCFSFEGECHQEYAQLKAARNDVNNFISIKDRCTLG